MSRMERQGFESKKPASAEFGRQMSFLGVLAENAAQAAEVHRALSALAARCSANMVESAVAIQGEIARMTVDAVVHRDPGALMSIGARAIRSGFRETMDCAGRNLQAAQAVGAQILDTVSTPQGAGIGTP